MMTIVQLFLQKLNQALAERAERKRITEIRRVMLQKSKIR